MYLRLKQVIRKKKPITIPRSHDTPVKIYEVKNGQELAFPWLFPTGQFGYLNDRQRKVTPAMYFKSRFYNKNSIWRKDISYLLHAAASYDQMLLKTEIEIYLKMRMSVTNYNNGSVGPVTAKDVRNIQENPDVLQNSYMFMKNIRGTVLWHISEMHCITSWLC